MTTTRRFAAFSEDGREGLGMAQVPKGGLCISSFLVITEKNRQGKNVLVGRINPKVNWDHIGAVNPGRLERASKGWMLPASHLMMLESPIEAAKRIVREQLELDEDNVALGSNPIVFSDVGDTQHWDIGFVFAGSMAREDLPKNPGAWFELKFVDFENTPKTEFVRFHGDVIGYAT